MPCFHPIKGWIGRDGKFTTNSKKTWLDKREEVQIPCGQCLGCRLEYSRQWAIRCQHEMYQHKENMFITMTYDDDHLPRKGVCKKHVQDFIKRLRDHLSRDEAYKKRLQYYHVRDPSFEPKTGIRYFGCSEYGSTTFRPHYHFIIFGYLVDDLVLYSQGKTGCKVYLSEKLSKIWSHGNVLVGESCNFETAAYIARYVVKQFEQKELLYERNKGLCKNFILSSRRPAVGLGFFEENKQQLVRLDKVLIREGVRCLPPKYYDKKLKEFDQTAFERNRLKRIEQIKEEKESVFYHRLLNKEQITEQKVFKERNL